MKIVKGNKQTDILFKEFSENFKKVVVDLGTGDGRFVYKKALIEKDTLFVGIDPSAQQLEIYSKKAIRKKLTNALFVLGSLELIPEELTGSADELFVIFPWGSLLQAIAVPNENLKNVLKILKVEGTLTLVLGYSKESEPSETRRLELPEINLEYISKFLIPTLNKFSLIDIEIKQLNKSEIKELGTSWANTLTFGKERPIFRIKLIKSEMCSY